jgi:hypothetical protein
MIAQANGVSFEVTQQKLLALHDQLLEAEIEVVRLRTTFNNVREGLENLEAMSGTTDSFEDAAKHVRTDYAHLLQKLSQ